MNMANNVKTTGLKRGGLDFLKMLMLFGMVPIITAILV